MGLSKTFLNDFYNKNKLITLLSFSPLVSVTVAASLFQDKILNFHKVVVYLESFYVTE